MMRDAFMMGNQSPMQSQIDNASHVCSCSDEGDFQFSLLVAADDDAGQDNAFNKLEQGQSGKCL